MFQKTLPSGSSETSMQPLGAVERIKSIQLFTSSENFVDQNKSGVILGAPAHCPVSYRLAKEKSIEFDEIIDEKASLIDTRYHTRLDEYATVFDKNANENIIADLGSAIFRLKTSEFEVPVLKGSDRMLMSRQLRQFVLEPEKMKTQAISLLENLETNSEVIKETAADFFDRSTWSLSTRLQGTPPLPIIEDGFGKYLSNREIIKRFQEIRPKYANEYPFWLINFRKMVTDDVFPNNDTGFNFLPRDSFCPSFTFSAVSHCITSENEFDIMYGSPEKISDFLGRSLAVSIAANDGKPALPVKQIFTHGTVLNKKGEKFEDVITKISGYRPQQLQLGLEIVFGFSANLIFNNNY